MKSLIPNLYIEVEFTMSETETASNEGGNFETETLETEAGEIDDGEGDLFTN